MFHAPYMWNQEPEFPIRFFFCQKKSFRINPLSSIQVELILDLVNCMCYYSLFQFMVYTEYFKFEFYAIDHILTS